MYVFRLLTKINSAFSGWQGECRTGTFISWLWQRIEGAYAHGHYRLSISLMSLICQLLSRGFYLWQFISCLKVIDFYCRAQWNMFLDQVLSAKQWMLQKRYIMATQFERHNEFDYFLMPHWVVIVLSCKFLEHNVWRQASFFSNIFLDVFWPWFK